MTIEFNTGFISAIALFLEHKNMDYFIFKNKKGKITSDYRLYTATDHLYDIEIPKTLPAKLQKRIFKWRMKCFNNRLKRYSNTKIADKLFKEAEDILAYIDNQIFKTKQVTMNYR